MSPFFTLFLLFFQHLNAKIPRKKVEEQCSGDKRYQDLLIEHGECVATRAAREEKLKIYRDLILKGLQNDGIKTGQNAPVGNRHFSSYFSAKMIDSKPLQTDIDSQGSKS